MTLHSCDTEEENEEEEKLSESEKAYFDVYGGKMPKCGNGKLNKQKITKSNSYNTTKEEEEEDKNRKAYPISKYSKDIPLAESILINDLPYFIQIIDGDNLVTSEKIPLSDIDLLPPERTEYLTKEYSFSSVKELEHFIELAKQEDLDSIFEKVKSQWSKFIDINEDFINLCTADTIFSYFQDKMGMTHYLLIVGDNNTGKSNILLLFSILGYRALYDTSITAANIYNFGGQLEEGQGIIIEDEIDDIDFQDEKKKLYKVSYRSGTKVTRMYDNNAPVLSAKRKSSRQQAFLPYSFKVFASEKIPDKVKSKGFLERIIPLKSVSGDPQFDISEVVNDAGDTQLKKLNDELIHLRKLLLIFRLLHHNDPISNVTLNIKNRYKQLTKPLIRLFQNTESLEIIIKSLSKYVIEKNEEKINSLDSGLLFLIIDLVSDNGNTLYNEQIWQKVKEKFNGNEIDGKPYSYFSEDYGPISKTKITNICETKLGGKQHKHKEHGRGLIFNPDTLKKLSNNYSLIEGIKIIKDDEEQCSNRKDEGDTSPTCDTFTEYVSKNDNDQLHENVNKMTNMTHDHVRSSPKNDNIITKYDNTTDEKSNGHSLQVSQVSHLSPNQNQKQVSSCKCNYCTMEFSTSEEHLKHCVNNHKGLPAKPTKELIETMLQNGENVEVKGNSWE